jgi:serine/threonine protein phosphatase PrpC
MDVDGGSTALFLLLTRAQIYTANAGDARAVLIRDNFAPGQEPKLGESGMDLARRRETACTTLLQLTDDHNLTSTTEIDRIVRTDGMYISSAMRFCGTLAAARAFGNYRLPQIPSCAVELSSVRWTYQWLLESDEEAWKKKEVELEQRRQAREAKKKKKEKKKEKTVAKAKALAAQREKEERKRKKKEEKEKKKKRKNQEGSTPSPPPLPDAPGTPPLSPPPLTPPSTPPIATPPAEISAFADSSSDDESADYAPSPPPPPVGSLLERAITTRRHRDRYLVIGCDGIYESVMNEDILSMLTADWSTPLPPPALSSSAASSPPLPSGVAVSRLLDGDVWELDDPDEQLLRLADQLGPLLSLGTLTHRADKIIHRRSQHTAPAHQYYSASYLAVKLRALALSMASKDNVSVIVLRLS